MEYTFWVWKDKLSAVMTMLSLVAGASWGAEAWEEVRYALQGTSNEVSRWVNYTFPPTSEVHLRLALDEDDTDLVHLALTAPPDLFSQIKLVAAIQASCTSFVE
jgi:hypothetical protein